MIGGRSARGQVKVCGMIDEQGARGYSGVCRIPDPDAREAMGACA